MKLLPLLSLGAAFVAAVAAFLDRRAIVAELRERGAEPGNERGRRRQLVNPWISGSTLGKLIRESGDHGPSLRRRYQRMMIFGTASALLLVAAVILKRL